MIDTNPYLFNPGYRRRRRAPVVERGITLDAPPAYAPDCPIGEREASLAALAEMQANRPLRPPGRRT